MTFEGIGKDIHELRQRAERAEQSCREKDAGLAAALDHLRNCPHCPGCPDLQHLGRPLLEVVEAAREVERNFPQRQAMLEPIKKLREALAKVEGK